MRAQDLPEVGHIVLMQRRECDTNQAACEASDGKRLRTAGHGAVHVSLLGDAPGSSIDRLSRRSQKQEHRGQVKQQCHYEDEIPQHSLVGLGQHPPNVHRNELVNFSKSVGQFFNKIKECALISQRALTGLVPARLDNVGALAH